MIRSQGYPVILPCDLAPCWTGGLPYDLDKQTLTDVAAVLMLFAFSDDDKMSLKHSWT